MTGGNSEAVPNRKGKRKVTEENSDEAKKVKLTELTTSSSSAGPPSAGPSSSSPSANVTKEKKMTLLGHLLNDTKVDAGRGFGLFD
jgi:hypothetical protein